MSREEDAYVIERMGKLLAEIAIIVNGAEPHDTLWSYHDLPEKVRALKQAQQPAAAAVPPDYALVPKDIHPLEGNGRPEVERLLAEGPGKGPEKEDPHDFYSRWWGLLVAAATQAPPAAVVPPGYALVPVEPTEAMLDAGWLAGSTSRVWAAMLAAAERKGE